MARINLTEPIKIIPIWFDDKGNGIFIKHHNGDSLSSYPNLSRGTMDLLRMTGIRIWEEKYIGMTYKEIIESYSSNWFVKVK